MIPKFHFGNGRVTKDWSSKENAIQLSVMIKKRWKDCGYVVHTRLIKAVDYKEPNGACKTIYGVKSDLVNGLPKNYGMQ